MSHELTPLIPLSAEAKRGNDLIFIVLHPLLYEVEKGDGGMSTCN
jgi:hypothetical protein